MAILKYQAYMNHLNNTPNVNYKIEIMIKLFLVLFIFSSTVEASCTKLDESCTEWINVDKDSKIFVYRNHSTKLRNEKITQALVVIHGIKRNADKYFSHILLGASLANALDNTIIIAPRFASSECKDKVSTNELDWHCKTATKAWRTGGYASNREKVSSFDALDTILKEVSKKEIFPNLKSIVVAGHSAGGQFVTRYQMTNKVHDKLNTPVKYVIANPSSFAYPDNFRPVNAEVSGLQFKETEAINDNWPFGLKNRTGYAERIATEDIKRQLVTRKAVYLFGELDRKRDKVLDVSPEADAQGENRLARGLAFTQYIHEKYHSDPKIVVVPRCGHNARCMFSSKKALPYLFLNYKY